MERPPDAYMDFDLRDRDGEEWKVIDMFQTCSISTHGRVKSTEKYSTNGKRFWPAMIYKQEKIKKGYLRIYLRSGGLTPVRKLVHVLSAAAFLGEKPTLKHEVNHKDTDKTNNYSNNLEYTTPSENMKHAYDNGRKKMLGSSHPMSKISEKQVREIRNIFNGRVPGKKEAAKIGEEYGMCNVAIINLVKGNTYASVI